MILVETGKKMLLQQGQKKVMSTIHQDFLDEVLYPFRPVAHDRYG